MKARWAVFSVGCAALVLLTGCSGVDKSLGNVFFQRAGISEQGDYQKYQEYLEGGQLNEDGTYRETRTPVEKADIGQGPVHVTFATNSFLNVRYYLDEEQTKEITEGEYNLNPGDSVYAFASANERSQSNLYHFKEYQIFEYDAEGKRTEIDARDNADGMIYTIPADFQGTELAIQPVGEYKKRTFDSLYVYYRDGANQIGELSNAGTWTVNGSENLESVSAVEAYILRFKFDTDNYFYVSANPEPVTKHPNNVGYIEFPEEDATEETKGYSVELHKHISVALDLDEDGKVSLNDGAPEEVLKGKTWSRTDLKYGDKIVVETKGEPKVRSTEKSHIKEVDDPVKDGTRYVITITSEMQDASEYAIEDSYLVRFRQTAKYGTCIYKVDGKEVKGWSVIGEKQKLTLTYKIEKAGYEFANGSLGLGGKLLDLVKPKERTVAIPVDASLEGRTLCPEDYFDIVKKEG